ncbi:MAG: diacylglycerol kinase family protein [Bacteroidota bacterium]
MQSQENWFVIVNPTAGSNRAGKRWNAISAQLDAKSIKHDFAYTKRRRHASVLARDAIRKGYRKIIAVGGDGTNNEVMNGILFQKVVPSHEVTFAVIPQGTGNDWIRTHKIPRNANKAIEIIAEGRSTLQDIGLVTYDRNGSQGRRYFMNVAGMAYDAFVTRVSNVKRNYVSNKIFYLFLVLKCLWEYKLVPARLLFDGQEVIDEFYIITVGICIYNGGGMQFVPHAIPDDGLFALTYAGKLSKFEVIKNTPRFYDGSLAKHPRISTHQAKSIKVETSGDTPTLLEVDGEYLGVTPVEYTMLEKALRVVVP